MSVSRNQTAQTLGSVYSNRTFSGSTVQTLAKANALQADPQGGILEESLRAFIGNTRAEDYSTYPDPTGGLLRVSVIHKREDFDLADYPEERQRRTHLGIDLNDRHDQPLFLKGLEGVWAVSPEGADLAVARGTHLLGSLRGYTHPSMIRKIVGWTSPLSRYRWFETVAPDPAVLAWIGTGVVLPRDTSTGVWGWAIRPSS